MAQNQPFDVFWGASKIPWDLLGHRPALEAPSASHPRLEAFHHPQPGSGAVFWWGVNNSNITGIRNAQLVMLGKLVIFWFREIVKPFPMIFFEDLQWPPLDIRAANLKQNQHHWEMSAVHQLYDFVSLISACCYMDPSRNLTQSIPSSRKPEFFKTITSLHLGMVPQVWSCWTSCSQAGNQLQIHDDILHSRSGSCIIDPDRTEFAMNVPSLKKTPKEVETTIYCSPKSGWYFKSPLF